jgi:hypothetical protein
MQSPMTLGNMRANSVNTLTLKRASTHRPGGPWSEDDYDVYDGEWIIGRIARTSFAPQDCSWFGVLPKELGRGLIKQALRHVRSRPENKNSPARLYVQCRPRGQK